MAAHSAGLDAKRDGRGFEAGFAQERSWQATWLAERLALAA